MTKLAILGGRPLIQKQQPLSKMFIECPLEKRFCEYVGSEFALSTSSGTSALICALIGAGIGYGDEVITVAYSWYCSATAILQVGAIPIFVDIDELSFCIDPKKIEKRITKNTKAILAISLYGNPANYDQIMPIAKKHKLVVIDDACQSTGAAIGKHKLGSIADITAFSFSGKPLSSTGGGIITTNNQEYFERAMLGGEHPSFISTNTKNPEIWKFASTGGYGNHYRIDGKCKERAYEQLEKLQITNQARRENVKYLISCLQEFKGIITPIERSGTTHVYHMLSCLFDSSEYGITRDEFVDALNAEGLPTMTYISSINFLKDPEGKSVSAGPLHLRPLFQELALNRRCGPFFIPKDINVDYSNGSLPVTEQLVDQEFNIHQRWLSAPWTKRDMDRYYEVIKKVILNVDQIIQSRTNDYQRKPSFFVAYESDS